MSQPAVLLMAYGSAPTVAESDVRAYLDHILQHYRKVSATDQQVADLRSRYQRIGGSPLYETTHLLADKLRRRLRKREGEERLVDVAMKHSPPFIGDVVRRIGRDTTNRAVAIALAPFRSKLTSDAYFHEVREAAAHTDVEWQFPVDWHLHPRFLALWRHLIRAALVDSDPVVIFTNHSLPARTLAWEDPYADQFAQASRALALSLKLERWSTAFQSAGSGGQLWLGPSLFEVVGGWIDRGETDFVIAPIGFLMDHLEVRYDLDVDAVRMAKELKVSLRRTAMPNAEPAMVDLLVELVGGGRDKSTIKRTRRKERR